MTFSQLCKIKRPIKQKKAKTPMLAGRPQRAIRLQVVTTTTPKKPNSANRKIAKGYMSNLTSKVMIGYITGEKHKLQSHNVVLVQGGGARDTPGASRYSIIRGTRDHAGVENRKNGRSLYGTKKGK